MLNPLLLKAGGGIAVGLLLLGLISRCQASGFNERTAELIKANDSLRVVVQIRDSVSRAAENRADRATAEKLIAQDRAREAMGEADRLRAQRRVIVPVANQPEAGVTVSDSLRAVESALVNCDQETVALRNAITQDSIALAKADVTEAELRGSLALERQSVADLTANSQRLAEQLAAAAPPCRVAFFPCPSRKTVFIGGAGIGAVITWVLIK